MTEGVADLMDRTVRDDGELLAAIASRDAGAFTLFYERHLPTTLAYLMRQMADPELAGDLAAEVFAAVLLAAHRYRQQGPLASAWVLGIARTKLLLSLRRGRIEAEARRRVGFEALELDDTDLDRIIALADGAAGRLTALADTLPEDERQALLGRVVQERSDADIAAELRCSEMVMRKRASRGLSRIRERLGQGRS
jgi:RNA polymerase sigma factor (sigma-70 family)